MKPKVTKRIMACLNTSPDTVKTILDKYGYKLSMVLDIYDELPTEKKLIIGFTSLTSLVYYLPNIIRPCILWDSVNVVRHLHINQPVHFLDADIKTNGLVLFKKLNTELLLKMVKRKFVFKSDIVFEKSQAKTLGNGSELSIKFNKFLTTLPAYLYEPTIIALTNSFRTLDYTSFDSFIQENRLLTNVNKKEYTSFVDYVDSIKEPIEWCVKKDKKKLLKFKNKPVKTSLARVRFFLSYFGDKSLTPYLDSEGNVNLNTRSV